MSLAKKKKIDLCENVINQIDIASENFLLENTNNENFKETVNKMRMEMIAKVKEIERLNQSNKEQKYVHFFQDLKSDHDHDRFKNKKRDNLLGNLIILNQDLSHLFKHIW